MPAMSDAPLRGYNGRHEWFWEPGDEAHIYPLENLMDMYYHSVGHNSTLIVGLTPGPDGLLPEPDVIRLKEWGDEIRRRFADPVARTSGSGTKIEIKLNPPRKINHFVLKEEIAKGERIRKFTVEALISGKWQSIFEGSVIGHKLIQRFDDIETRGLRLRINESIDKPLIKDFAAFYIE
jgi:alpha-L-fucosidase